MARQRITAKQLMARWERSRRTLTRFVKEGKLPQPHYFLGQAAWYLDEVEEAEEKLTSATPLATPQHAMAVRG